MSTSVATRRSSFGKSLGRFGLHFMEMCAVMCVGGLAIDLVVFQAAAALGYSATSYPVAGFVGIGLAWAIAMTLWMRARGHAWAHTVEMSVTAVAVAGVFAIATGAGWMQTATPMGWVSLYLAVCGPACLVMALDMALHFNHYGAVEHAGHDRS